MYPKLFMVLIGCKPPNRNIEQHDIFFGIGNQIKDLVPAINLFWPEAMGKIHLDAYTTIEYIEGFEIKVVPKNEACNNNGNALFFINLGGYKQNEFEEYHYKMLTVATEKTNAINKAKLTAFYKHTGFKQAPSHIDDKYGIDVDDIFAIEDILLPDYKNKFHIQITSSNSKQTNEMQIGYFPLSKL